MKNLRSVFVCLLLIVLLLSFSGCGAKDEWEAAKIAAVRMEDSLEDPQLREYAEKMLDALVANDFITAYSLVSGVASEAEFQSVFSKLQAAVGNLGAYELIASNINKNVTNGTTTVSVRYMMTAGETRLFVEAARVEGYDGLTAFHISEYVPVVTTGSLGNMQGASALQWTFLIVGLLELAFVLWMFADCCRHKVRKKWLWLLLIALGCLLISVIVTPEQYRLNFNLGAVLSYTCLIRYSTGGFIAQIAVPVGAILYAALRKSLFARYAQKQAEAQALQQPEVPAVQDAPAEETETAKIEE